MRALTINKAWYKCLWLRTITMIIFIISANIGVGISANAQNTSVEELRELGEWAQEYSSVVENVSALYDMEKIDAVLDAMDTIDTDNFKNFDIALKIWTEDVDQKIKRLEIQTRNFPSPPYIKSLKRLNDVYIEQAASIRPMVDASIESVLHMKTGFSRIRSGDDSGVTQIWIAQQDAAQRAIQSETVVIKSALAELGKDHPNYYFQKVILADDNFTLSEIELTKLNLLGQSTLETRTPFLNQMQKELENYAKAIPLGHKATIKMRKTLQREAKRYKKSAKTYDDLIKAMDTFSETFNVESEILNVQKRVLATYKKDIPIDEIDTLVEPINAEYFPLIDKRANLYDQRANILANLGK